MYNIRVRLKLTVDMFTSTCTNFSCGYCCENTYNITTDVNLKCSIYFKKTYVQTNHWQCQLDPALALSTHGCTTTHNNTTLHVLQRTIAPRAS